MLNLQYLTAKPRTTVISRDKSKGIVKADLPNVSDFKVSCEWTSGGMTLHFASGSSRYAHVKPVKQLTLSASNFLPGQQYQDHLPRHWCSRLQRLLPQSRGMLQSQLQVFSQF